MSRVQEVEQFFKNLFELIPIPYKEFNHIIPIPEDNVEALLNLEKSCPNLILREGDGTYYVTTISIFATFSKFFLRGDEIASFLVNDTDTICGVKIINPEY